MERLTKQDAKYTTFNNIKLQQYENTGLEPEEIEELKRGYRYQYESLTFLLCETDCEVSHVKELLTAEKEGRLVVLPCKVGDTVYRIYDDCEFPGDCHTKRKCNGCEYRNLYIEEHSFCISMLCQNGKLGAPYYLTREEAEAALKKGGSDGSS